ncbi:MAG: hypothetical protein SOV57_01055 [Bacilli bacterium]|uniref:hypothetical protein n=1 Tax=uncultured Methanobrevibacter sp. TaxID=253161 RepID=UPI0025FB8C4C|nr:hypothetical protein [uncultured Methanobrevibacter sp.]MDY2745778.1 hypothetical protein [Bacilli bacterium]
MIDFCVLKIAEAIGMSNEDKKYLKKCFQKTLDEIIIYFSFYIILNSSFNHML